MIAGRITTYSGNQFNILNPEPDDFRLEDIAHALSMKCRYNGMCKEFYSVAQHSFYASFPTSFNPEFADRGPLFAKALLMHDATEAYMQDLPRPLKVLFPDYIKLEHELGNKIAVAFGLPVGAFEDPELKAIDMRLMALEATVMMNDPESIFAWTGGAPDSSMYQLTSGFTFWTPDVAEKMFIKRFWDIRTELRA